MTNDITIRSRGEGSRLASFVVTGGVAACVNLVSRWLLSFVVIYELSVTLAYLVGMTTAFLLARRFVFDRTGHGWLREFYRFALVNGVSFLIVLAVSVGFARVIFPLIKLHWHAEDLAHLIGVASPILLSYYAHKRYSFAKRPEAV